MEVYRESSEQRNDDVLSEEMRQLGYYDDFDQAVARIISSFPTNTPDTATITLAQSGHKWAAYLIIRAIMSHRSGYIPDKIEVLVNLLSYSVLVDDYSFSEIYPSVYKFLNETVTG